MKTSIPLFTLIPLLILIALTMMVHEASAQSGNPPFECTTNAPGLLFQYPHQDDSPTSVSFIDLVTGEDETPYSLPDGYSVNAIGYNVLDNYVYGHRRDPADPDLREIVRVGADGSVEGLGYPTNETVLAINRHIGDVDENGHYWISNGSDWWKIDLDPSSTTYFDLLDSGTHTGITGNFADWAYVPGGGNYLYTVSATATGSQLYRFDRDDPHDFEPVGGSLGDLGGAMGGHFADDGFLYGSVNNTGEIYRIDIQNGTATKFADGPTSGGNDGARCPSPILIDFGDAPDSYGTTLATDGARHGIPGYDENTSEAPLMLGATVDAETDGQPGTAADGDGGDEDGVAAPIVITEGAQTIVSASATNTSGEPATLAGWIDLDGNGTFDAGELQTATVPAGTTAGDFDLTFDPPTALGNTYARFRIFPGDIPAADLSPTGPAAAGEVEDYPVTGPVLPPWECGTNFSGLLFQHSSPRGTPTTLHLIEMVTGEFESGFSIDGRPINAVGYNVLDDYVYGWDLRAGEIVRIGGDGSTEGLGTPEGYVGRDHMIIGDVDDNGHYWFAFPGDNAPIWHQVDLDVNSPDFMTVIRTVRPDTWPGSNDWAYVPGTDALWTIGYDDNGDNTLIRFDRGTGTFSDEGSLGVGSAINSGAMYADTDGFLYTSNNGNGLIHRVDVENVTATLFAQGPASTGNDGARCPSPVLLDLGDAPDSYGTELASNGPRHGIPDYNEQTGEAPLMLGVSIDPETDGFPGPDADGDDADNLGDEDGIAAPIVITEGAQTIVSASATNTSGEPATLAGWIDLDGNGTFDAGELQTATVPAGTTAGDFDLTFEPPTALGNTYARFRIFPGDIPVADLSPTGPAAAGEVEDYLVTDPTQIQPFECTTNDPGLLFQNSGGPLTEVQAVDLVTGDVDTGTIIIDGRSINATGYNVLDDYLYGYDVVDETGIVRIGADGSVEVLGIPSHADLDPTRGFTVGDVDGNGHYWAAYVGSTADHNRWFQIDLNPGATFMQVLSTDLVNNAGSDFPPGNVWKSGGDWAWVPGGGDNLWRVMHNENNGDLRLWRFDMATGTHHAMPGTLNDPLGAEGGSIWGSAFADDQYLYVSSNQSGNIYRVDIQNATATLFTTAPPSGGDGARCPSPIYTDYGDAPDSYGTLLEDDGPRHGLRDYDPDTNTTPLMLGATVDAETDGQPSAAADGDGGDEDGVVSAITLDTANPIEVEMLVTNNTDEPATLVGWIDLGGTQSFDTGDRSNVITIPANTTDTFTLTFAPATTTADTYARFRLFPGEVDEQDLSPLGPASAGEVEDYPVPTSVVEIDLTGGPCWRMLSSPVQGLTYADMLENLWTQGASGSDYPAGDPNVFLWPDGQTGNDPAGWQPLGDLNQVIPPGTGFLISVYADDDYDGVDDPFPKTLSVSGPAHGGDITPPMNTNPDGWTLVGNPYSQPVDFSALTTTELTDIGYVYDRNYGGADGGDTNGNTGGWRSTDGTYGDVTDGAFAPGQGFFVQNTDLAGSPSITFTEGSQTTGGEFYGKQDEPNEPTDYLRLEVQGESLYNSVWIRFSGDGSVEPAYGMPWSCSL